MATEESTGTRAEPKRNVPGEEPYPPQRTAWFAVGVLLLIYIFSFMDRQILNLLVRPIKSDLGISDTQMSYLMGFSFAVFYAVFGLPLGRMADSVNRKGLIAVGLALWTAMTAGCGLVKVYIQFLIMRIGVGVGEASLSPSAYSMITDYFPKDKLARALATYGMGISMGSGMAMLVGGSVAAWAATQGDVDLGFLGVIHPWQLVFISIGFAGIAPLILLWFVKEPPRRGVRMVKSASGKQVMAKVSVPDVLRYLGQNWKTVLCHHTGFALLAFSGYGVAAWIPAFMDRTHGWGPGQVGLFLGLRAIFFSSLGIIAGGALADWLTKKGYTDSAMRVGLLSSIIWIPPGILYPLVSNEWVCYGIMTTAYFFGAFTVGVGPAALQNIMPNRMRGLASAMYLFVINLIGLGIGPTAVALFTDYVFEDEQMLRYSILVVSLTAHILAVCLFALGLKPFRESVERLKEWEKANA